jgi:hypothetical protein
MSLPRKMKGKLIGAPTAHEFAPFKIKRVVAAASTLLSLIP